MKHNTKRIETRKHQREAREHFHPRALARSIAHSRAAHSEISGINKVTPGTTQSAFAQTWRRDADLFAREA